MRARLNGGIFSPVKAAYITQNGPADSILYGELPVPVPAGAQVLVRVKAVSVNPVDTYIRAGTAPAKLPFPFIVGCDLAGVVESVGPGASRFKPGDRVWGTNQGLLGRQGTFSEFAAVDEQWLYPTPPGVSDEQAAAMALVGITAHLGLCRDARLLAGEILFVNGGAGGVGSVVVQMARILGAEVIATAGSAERTAVCRQLGATHAINYKSDDVDARIKEAAPGGVNVWWELLREPDLERAVAHLAPRGRLIVMAGREARPAFPLGPFYVKGCSMHGFAMFMATPAEQQQCAEDINRWMTAGLLAARIDRVLPLSEAAAAHRIQEENTLRKAGTLSGKIVLVP